MFSFDEIGSIGYACWTWKSYFIFIELLSSLTLTNLNH